MTNVTILGTGEMGSRITQVLLNKGFKITIYNRTANRAQSLVDNGAIYKATPLDAVKNADYVISMLTNDQASKSVWLDDKHGAFMD